MLVTYIRSSSYNQWAYCQMSYFMTYVLGHYQDSGKKAELGTMVHKVMEVLAGLKKFNQDNPKAKFLKVTDDAIGDYKVQVSKFLTNECVDELIDMSIKSYQAQSKHSWSKSDFAEVKRLTYLTLDYNNGQFDPRLRNVIDPEPHFDIPIEEDWAHFDYELPTGETVKGQLAIKGTIDLVTKVSDDVIEVVDWKTGRRLDWATGEEKDYEKLCKDPQLLLYNYAISKLYPQYNQAIMTIFFIKDGGPFSMCFDKKDQEKFLSMLKDRYEEIKANSNPQPLSPDRSHWKCTRLCHFYKNKWPGTNQNMCMYIESKLKKEGMEQTVKDCTRKGFSIGYYESPG